MRTYIPNSIKVISAHECQVTYDTNDGVKVSKYLASKIIPGESVIFDCSDPEYWHFTSASDALREFDRTTIGGIFFLNSFESSAKRPKLLALSIIDESEEYPIFEVLFDNPKVSVVCHLDRENSLIFDSERGLPDFYADSREKEKFVKMLSAFEIAYWAKFRKTTADSDSFQ